MAARFFLLAASLLIPCTGAAKNDPVQISLRGTTIERVPDEVITITPSPEQAWKNFLRNEDARALGDAREGHQTGFFSTVRRGIVYLFCEQEQFSKSLDGEGTEIPASALVYVWRLGSDLWHVGDVAIPGQWARAHRLELMVKKESDTMMQWLYRSPDGAFIVFLHEKHLVCPMHPERKAGDGARCEICGMSKVPAWQVPPEKEEHAEQNSRPTNTEGDNSAR